MSAGDRFRHTAIKLNGSTAPRDRAERAAALCYLQREEEAAELIRDIAFDSVAAQAHSLLARHFASRETIVKDLGIDDPAGIRWAKHYRSHRYFTSQCKLSAVLIVKNEAEHIANCLSSLIGLAHEIVVVDTGSTDETMSIVKSFTNKFESIKLGSFEWCDDFAAARNAALKLATCDWGLWIDADEVLDAEAFAEIRQALIRPYFGGFHVRIVNYTADDNDNSTYTHAPLRLFRVLPGVQFVGRIHEQIASSIGDLQLPIGSLETATIYHHGYRPKEMASKNKYDRFLTMLEREVRDEPENGFQWFNLANAYTLVERFQEAEHAARMAVKLAEDRDSICLGYQLLAGALIATDQADQALEVLAEARTRGYDSVLLYFEQANALLRLGRLEDALQAINQCFQQEWGFHATGDASLMAYKRHVVKGQILALLGRTTESIAMFDQALAVNPTYSNALYLKAATLAAAGRNDEAMPIFRQGAKDPEVRAICLAGLGNSFEAVGQHKASAAAFEEAWKLAPDNYDMWASWAGACESANDLGAVVQAYSAFAHANEMSAELLVNWGRALDRAGQPQRALDCFIEAVQKSPEDANAYFNAGDLLYKAEQYQDAAHLYEGGLRLNPGFAEGWFVLGNSLAQMGLFSGAEIAYKQTLEHSPNHLGATQNLKTILLGAAA